MSKNILLKLKSLLLTSLAISLLITGSSITTISCSDPITGTVLDQDDTDDERPPDDDNDPDTGEGGGMASAKPYNIMIGEDYYRHPIENA